MTFLGHTEKTKQIDLTIRLPFYLTVMELLGLLIETLSKPRRRRATATQASPNKRGAFHSTKTSGVTF